MLPDELKEAFATAVDEAAAARDRRSDQLKRVVYDVVDVFKSQGWPAERIIIYLRGLLRHLPAARQYPVSDSLTEWCLARYYPRSDARAHAGHATAAAEPLRFSVSKEIAAAIALESLLERMEAQAVVRDARLVLKDCGGTFDVSCSAEMACQILEALQAVVTTRTVRPDDDYARLMMRLVTALDAGRSDHTS